LDCPLRLCQFTCPCHAAPCWLLPCPYWQCARPDQTVPP
jgi:hypothetical protein